MHLLFIEPFLTPILFILIAVILLSGFFLIKSIYTKEKEFQTQESDAFSNYEKILTDAHGKAEHIIQDAAQEASKLSQEGNDFSHHVTEEVNHAYKEIIEKHITELTAISQELTTSYQTTVQELKKRYESEIGATITKMQQDTLQNFAQVQEIIRQKTLATDTGFAKQLQDEFTKTQVEIHEYKKKKLQDITQHMDTLIMQVAEEVLGKSIPISQHQDLITKALEKAQKEGMFDV